MSNSIDQLTAIAADLQASGKEVSLKVLRRRGPRKGETWSKSPAGMVAGRALGAARNGDTTTKATIAGGGREQTMTKVCGIGKEMVKDLEGVVARYNAQIRADKIADRRAERLGIA